MVTKLSTFAFKSAFRTWVFRVASNYLLDESRRRAAEPTLTFDDYRADLEADLRGPVDFADSPEYPLLLNEVRLGCTMAMLLCLDRKHRLAYVLGDIFELDHRVPGGSGAGKVEFHFPAVHHPGQSEFLEPGCDVPGGQLRAGRSRVAPLEKVRGQKIDMGLHLHGGDGVVPASLRICRKDWNQE